MTSDDALDAARVAHMLLRLPQSDRKTQRHRRLQWQPPETSPDLLPVSPVAALAIWVVNIMIEVSMEYHLKPFDDS
jgi:hypothetical protein